MDWAKDKKNQPIVIGASAVVLIGAIVFLLFQFGVLGGSGSAPPPPAIAGPAGKLGPTAPGIPGGPPGSGGPIPGGPPPSNGPSGPGGPPAANAQTAAKPAVPTAPRKAANADPFLVPGALLPKPTIAATPPISAVLPYVNIVRVLPKSSTSPGGPPPIDPGTRPPEVSTTQRMSGVLFTDKGIVGLLETNGQTQQVYPGDTVNDGSARVISIQSDGLILRRQSDNRLVRVPLSGVATGAAATPVPGGPGNPNPGAPPDNGDQ